MHDIGRCLVEMNKLTDAKECWESALKIEQRTSNDVTTDRQVAVTLDDISKCLIEMNKHTHASEYLKRALKI